MRLCLFGPALFDLFIPSSRTQDPERPRKTDRVPDGGTEQHRAAVGPHREAELGSHRGGLACVGLHPHVHVSRSQDSSEAAWMSTRTNTSRPSFMHCNVCSVQAWWPSSLASQQQRFHHNWKVFVVYTGAASSIQARCASSCKLLSKPGGGGGEPAVTSFALLLM